jgi:branched-chain amino acid transport system substrate-binding protein
MGRDRMNIRVLGLFLLAMLVGSALLVVGCGKAPDPVNDPQARLAGDGLAQAQRLYAQLKREHSLHRDRKSLEIAGTLLDYYPAFERNDEVLSLAVQSAYRLEDPHRALELTDEFLQKFPASALMDQRLLRGGEIALDVGDTLAAAEYLILHFDRDPQGATRSDGLPRAHPVIMSLSTDQVVPLREAEQGRPMWPYLSYVLARKQLEDGNYRQAEAVGDQMVDLGPDNRWLEMVKDLLAGGQPDQVAFPRPSGPVNVNRVGVLSPLTGRYAVLGNAFVDACLMALEKANADYGREFELLVEDTAGDPVNSALATRRLCGQEGCLALFGPMMSDPTAAAALVADLYGVPLVSPTATNDRVWQLGDRIFQTNLTGFYEVRLLAQLATTVMLKERFAIIHPDDPEGRRNAEVFAAEIEQLGGQVVAMASFPPQGTDFREPILQLREHRPEVIFAPATVDQMVLLGPQLDFFHAGALIMGLSNWNSQKLIDRAGTQLESAVFPSDQALIPPQWTAEFNVGWDDSNYPREATALALRAYQSMRMLLDTLATSGAVNRAQLAEALTRRLANRAVEAEGPDSYESIVRVFRSKRIVSFPANIFTEAWELTEGAAVDSLLVGEAGDLLEGFEEGEPGPEVEISPEDR